MKIGILQCGQAPETLRGEQGDYPDMFMRLLADAGFDFTVWHVEGGDFPAAPSEAEGWLITGSRHGVYEDHSWLPPLEDFIRAAYDAAIPIVGVCFGHQIIAKALGGQVEKYNKGWSVGAQQYRFGADTLTLNAWHQDQVIAPPQDAQTIGASDFCAHAALYYPGRALSVQAHPEFEDKFVAGLIEHRAKGVVPDDLLEEATSRMGGPRDSARIAAQIAAFFQNPGAAPR